MASSASKKQGLGAVDYHNVIDIEAQKDLFGFWGEIAWPDFPLDCDDVTVCKGVCLGRGGDAGVLDWMTACSEPKRKKLK